MQISANVDPAILVLSLYSDRVRIRIKFESNLSKFGQICAKLGASMRKLEHIWSTVDPTWEQIWEQAQISANVDPAILVLLMYINRFGLVYIYIYIYIYKYVYK